MIVDHPMMASSAEEPWHVVIIGSGFGALFAAKALRRAPVDVTIIARTTHHLFQPLLYQVATGILSPGEVAPATREILRRQRNVDVLLGEVTDVDVTTRTVTANAPLTTFRVPYDSLIVAAGAAQSYFGHDEFSVHAPGLKSLDDAIELRGRIFGAFELAELENSPAAVERWMTFVVIGAGPTGVEMAGQIAELARRTLSGEFRRIDPSAARIVLVDAADTVLGTFGDRLSPEALYQLHRLGVEVELGMTVIGVDKTGIEMKDRYGNAHRIDCMTKIWAAGVSASPLGARLARVAGAETDSTGRIKVEPDCTVPGHPEIFVVGDLMALDRLPGVAQVAIQSGQHAARQIMRRLHGKPTGQPFRYRDRGNMAIISRFCAVAKIGRVRLAGITGWLLWLAVHLLKLVGFKNRVTAVVHWFVSFVGRGRLDRTVTDLPFALHHGGAAMRRGAPEVRGVHEAGTHHPRRRVRGAHGLRRSGGQAGGATGHADHR
jgi:NADH:ubiquinone reductase (H+-translocating)